MDAKAAGLTKREIAAAVLGTAVHALSLAVELSRDAQAWGCCIVPLGLVGTFILAVHASTMRMRVLLLVQPALTLLLWIHLVHGAPMFVRRDAALLIAAIRQYHDMHGTYPPGGVGERETPPALLSLMRTSHCSYSVEEGDCRVLCRGVHFSSALYRFSTDSW